MVQWVIAKNNLAAASERTITYWLAGHQLSADIMENEM
jgi:hypothetical protein